MTKFPVVLDGSFMLHRSFHVYAKARVYKEMVALEALDELDQQQQTVLHENKAEVLELGPSGILTVFFGTFVSELEKITAYLKRSDIEVYVLWDMGESVRVSLNPDYKANREHDPESIQEIIYAQAREWLCQWFPKFNVISCLLPGIEADDLAYELTRQYTHGCVVSDDWDWVGTLRANWVLRRPMGNQFVDNEFLIKKKGYSEADPVRHFVYEKTLGGDKSDNIERVKGCTPKVAKNLSLALVTNNAHNTDMKSLKEEEHRSHFIENLKLVDMSYVNGLYKEPIQNAITYYRSLPMYKISSTNWSLFWNTVKNPKGSSRGNWLSRLQHLGL